MVPSPSAPTARQNNVEAILRLEYEQDQQMSFVERLSDAVGNFAGSFGFVVVQLGFVAIWIGLNLVEWPLAFDPLPFHLLSGIVALEGVLLTAFVLIRQNRMARKAEHRSHLDLQINLLSEQAITKVIQMIERLSREMGIESKVTDAESKEMARETQVEAVSQKLRESIPPEAPASG